MCSLKMDEDYFDFEEKLEEPEELDFNQPETCPHCKKPIPKDALMCLYCGKSVSSIQKPKWIIWVVILVIVAFIALVLI